MKEKLKKKIVVRDENTEKLSPPKKHRIHNKEKIIDSKKLNKFIEKEK